LTPSRLAAVGFIYACAAIAWFTLGASVVSRTGESDAQLAQEVSRLWGGPHNQIAPDAWCERPRQVAEHVQGTDEKGRPAVVEVARTVAIDRVPLPLESSHVRVDLQLDQRRKGLLWYDTYGVDFAGTYRVRNPDPRAQPLFVHFKFPSHQALYDRFVFKVNGEEAAPVSDLAKGITAQATVPPGGEAVVELTYRSRGLRDWTYSFVPSGVAQVRDFTLDVHTDFKAIDFPPGTISPGSKTEDGPGWRLGWRFASLVTGQRVGVDPPNRINPGPLTARITYFAPVSLLFFVTVMVMLGVLKERSLHPVNYAFLAAAFFAFHLLLAYLVDHLNVHLAFVLAALTSVFLVVSYLRLVGGLRFAVREAGLAQVVFLVLFSYAFFFEGYTGLTVTVGAVLTLFVLMQLTGRVDWGNVFEGAPRLRRGTSR
jgi:hypothetical protein